MEVKMEKRHLLLFVSLLFGFSWSRPLNLSGEVFDSPGKLLEDTLYVKPGAAGDCSSWEAACDLDRALSEASFGDEVWVAAGIYYPGAAGDQLATFILKNGIAVYGGFAGSETSREDRNWSLNTTTLSGDIDRNGKLDEGNARHVITSNEAGETTVLDGFTITGGNADGEEPNNRGGGMRIQDGSPILSNIIFSNNNAGIGGGLGNIRSSPRINNVTFIHNSAGAGGGMSNNDSSYPVLTNVIFSQNSASRGGGISNYTSSITLTNGIFYANSASSEGGGISSAYSGSTLTSVTFLANSARTGGAISNNDRCSTTLTNVTFSANTAIYAAGMYNVFTYSVLTNVTFFGNSAEVDGGAIRTYWFSGTTILNSILWGNTPGQIYTGEHSTTGVTYSNVQGGYEGEGNIAEDPLLEVLADNGGFAMTHALNPASPAIDAGNPDSSLDTDQRGELRPVDGDGDGQARCDMGAYEFQPARHLFLPALQR
jgi:predicted outer membrane repeat protein